MMGVAATSSSNLACKPANVFVSHPQS